MRLRLVLALIAALFFGSANQPAGAVGLNQLTCTPPPADPEIVALARSLNYDQNLIFEYIYYNIELSPTNGLKKSPLATYLDGRGNMFDQNLLFVTLLRQSCITAKFRVNTAAGLLLTDVANLFGVDPDPVVVQSVLDNGGFAPAAVHGSTVTNFTIVGTIAGSSPIPLAYNPAYKSHKRYLPIDIAAATGYTQSALLASSSSGSSSISGAPAGVSTVQNLNRANLTSSLNGYAENLANYIKANNSSASAKQLFGGREITSTNFTSCGVCTGTVYTDLPVGQFETAYTVSISDNPNDPNPHVISGAGPLYGSVIAGKRLTLTYSGGQPVLALEGQTIATGSSTSSATQTVFLKVTHNAYNPVITSTVRQTVQPGGTYAIMLSAGESGRDQVTRHQRLIAKYTQAGQSATSEPILGETLAAVGATYLSQASRAARLIENLGGSLFIFQHHMGIAGYNNQAVYVDFPGQGSAIASASTTTTEAARLAQFAALAMYKSTLESTAVTEVQKSSAASTVMMFDYANSDHTGFVQATAANWSTVRPFLTGWNTSALDAMGNYLGSDATRQVVVPQNGTRTVGTWVGSGYYQMSLSSYFTANVGYLISGGYKGAFGTGFDYFSGTINIWGIGLVSATVGFNGVNSVPYWDALSGSMYEIVKSYPMCLSMCGGFSWAAATEQTWYSPPVSNEPIDLLSGAYTYDHDDISVGSASFPFGLTLKRSYNSAASATQTPLGYGWRHSFMISAGKSTDSTEAFGDHNPLTAVSTVVAAYVMSDLMGDHSTSPVPPLANTVTASLTASWLMDQLRDNAVTVATATGTKKFIKSPTANGAGVYVPPPGDASVLIVNPDSTIKVTDKFQVVMNFAADGTISSWVDPNGNTVSFNYTAASGSTPPLLHTVSNGMGRSLTFTYNGSSQLTGVSDGTRTVTYTYDSAGNLQTFTDSAPTPATTTYVYDQPGRMTQMLNPSFPSTPFMTNVYDEFSRVQSQADASGNVWFYLFANGKRSQEINPEGGSHALYYDNNGNQTKDIDQVSNTRTMTYDGQGRLVLTVYPNGTVGSNPPSDAETFAYDPNHNVVSTTRYPAAPDSGATQVIRDNTDIVTGQAPTPITRTFTYDPTFNKVLTATDGLGNTTTSAYDASGNLLSVTQPGVKKLGTGGLVSPVSTFTYGVRGLVATSTDAEGRVTAYAYDPSTFDLLSVTADNAHLQVKTSYTYDAVGNQITVTDPKSNVGTVAYDGMRRVTQKAAPLSAVTTYAYDLDGRAISVSRATGNANTPWQTTTTSYNAAGKVVTTTQPDGTFVTNAYDIVGRLSTKTSSSGRQVLYNYDLASRVTIITDQTTSTLDPAIVNLGAVKREQRNYGKGGLLATLTDGKQNKLCFFYDGFKRLKEIVYPPYSACNSPNDHELHGYDANGNELKFVSRSGAEVNSTVDAINRQITKAPTGQPTISYIYDLTGRPIRVTDTSGTFQLAYDTAGRLTKEVSPTFGTTTALLDKNGNITRLTWPAGAGGYVTGYGYDALNRLTAINEGVGSAAVRMASYIYNPLSQRTRINLGVPGAVVASTITTYTPAGLINSVKHTWNGSNVTLSYGYNQDQQVTSLSATNNTFLPSGLTPGATSYASNALNQYSAVNGTTFSYDARGNLTSDGVWSFGYDTEDRLISASSTGTAASYAYDALGRRLSKTVNGTTTAWLSFGNQEIAEYQGPSGGTLSLVQKFVYSPGMDEPLAAVDAANNRTYHFTDAQGSVIGLANSSGQLTEKYTYTGYGVGTVSGPGTAVYRYAGRRYDAETGLYHNRARAYSPVLGRFLQADPSGLQGGIHLYAYAGNDPLNGKDPLGLATAYNSPNLSAAYGESGINSFSPSGVSSWDSLPSIPAPAGMSNDTASDSTRWLDTAVIYGATAYYGGPLLARGFGLARSLFAAESAVPLGFESAEQFGLACRQLCSALERSGITDAQIGVRGSAVTGVSSKTGAQFGAASDLDFFVESNQLVQGLKTSKNIPGMVYPSTINKAFQAVSDWASSWSATLGRKVSVSGFPIGGVPKGSAIYGPP